MSELKAIVYLEGNVHGGTCASFPLFQCLVPLRKLAMQEDVGWILVPLIISTLASGLSLPPSQINTLAVVVMIGGHGELGVIAPVSCNSASCSNGRRS